MASEFAVPVGTLALVQEAARQLGVEPDAVLRAAGVEPSALKLPMSPIAISAVARALVRGRELSGCEHFAILAGAQARLGNAGLVPLLLMHEKSVRDAIRDLIRFLRIWYRGVHLSLVIDDGWARFGIALGGVHAGHSELCAMYGASMNHHLHTIMGPQWHAARVLLTHARPEDVRPYTKILRAPVLFGQLETVIEFPAADLERTRTSSDEHVIRLLRAQLTSLEAEHRMTLAEQVRHLIEVVLGRGDCSAERVADMLSMHRKTLHRRLAQEGTTYKAELEAARRDAARRLLAQKKRRVSDVAVALGYSDSVNFTRAFRRWFGVAPRAWQSRQVPLDTC